MSELARYGLYFCILIVSRYNVMQFHIHILAIGCIGPGFVLP